MSYVLIALAAALASGLTLFSGFGLGTLLLPALALFLPAHLAVAATALVHAANNVFKVKLLGRYARWGVVLRFGLPAVITAALGARLLGVVAELGELGTYELFGRAATITPIKLMIAVLMALFAIAEFLPLKERLHISDRFLIVGGLLSGFFGGLSGHQGALRSAFLARTKVDPQSFAGTNAVIGLFVDASRLVFYGAAYFGGESGKALFAVWPLLLVAVLSAFVGALVGKRLLAKTTIAMIRRLTGVLLLIIAVMLGSGII